MVPSKKALKHQRRSHECLLIKFGESKWRTERVFKVSIMKFLTKKMRFSTKNACKILTNCPRNLNLDLKWSLELSWWLNTLLGKNYGSKALFENGLKMRDSNRTWVYQNLVKSQSMDLGIWIWAWNHPQWFVLMIKDIPW